MSPADSESTLSFLRDLIHEIKDPFAAIYGSLQLLPLLSSLPQDEREYLVESLQRNAQALKGVLEDASLFTAMASSQTRDLSPSCSCDLAAAFGGAMEAVNPRLVSREQTVPYPPPSGILVGADIDLLRPCLACLLGSLSRSSGHGEALICEVQFEGDEVSLLLQTSGRIQADGYRIQLASMLARALGAELRAVESGWLLALSRSKNTGGKKVDAGQRTVSSGSAVQEGAGLRVLVVEDNPLARTALASMIRGAGSIVVDVGSAEEAFESMNKEPPDLIFCDLGLPGVSDGLDLAHRVRSDPRTVQAYLVAVTGHAAGKEQQARQAGFDRVLEKPLDDVSLRQILLQTEPVHR